MLFPGLFAALALCAAGAPLADTDRDGAVSRPEFSSWAATLFQRLDTNRDGRVANSEWAANAQLLPGAFATRGFASTGQGGEANLFDQIDLNGDWSLSVAETDQMARERFAAFDTDRDGKLAGAELEAIIDRASH